jgi:hypothetical protein
VEKLHGLPVELAPEHSHYWVWHQALLVLLLALFSQHIANALTHFCVKQYFASSVMLM